MKTVIQDLNGNRLFYEVEKNYSHTHTFYTSDGKIIQICIQYPPDELIVVGIVDHFRLSECVCYYTPSQSTMWYDLNYRFGTTLVEDLFVFRRETIPNLVRQVNLQGKVTKKHIKQIKKLYDTSNWIWP